MKIENEDIIFDEHYDPLELSGDRELWEIFSDLAKKTHRFARFSLIYSIIALWLSIFVLAYVLLYL